MQSEIKSLISGTGFVVLSGQTYVSLTGDDRHAFFHNFCTNEIKKLEHGRTCETFVLNEKGKILSFVNVLAGENEMLLTGNGVQAPTLIAHLDKYLIRENVELTDKSGELVSVFVCQSNTNVQFTEALPAAGETVATEICDVKVRISSIELAGNGYLLTCDKTKIESLTSELVKKGLTNCSIESLHAIRVLHKTPWFGIDVTDSNLPQELVRDDKAINFNKGCYLGQETVARIDARGRVNNLLVGFRFENEGSKVGDKLVVDEKPIGHITSIGPLIDESGTISSGQIGLGFVKRKFADPGTEIAAGVEVA